MSISLQKGQRISLSKDNPTLEKVIFGVGWDVAQSNFGGGFLKKVFGGGASVKNIDLDASCVLFDSTGKVVDTVWFQKLRSSDGSVIHTGDNLTGEGDGDDEQIHVELSRIPSTVSAIVFTVNSFSGQKFNCIENAFCRIVDSQTQTEIAKLNLSEKSENTAIIMTQLYRQNGEWKVYAIDQPSSGRTWDKLLPDIQPHLPKS